MKKYMMMAALAAATISLTTSCSDEEMVKMSTKEGEPIRFTAVTKQAVETRTAYSTTTHEKNGKQYWDLYWVENDEVTIHCPEAQATEESGHSNTAEYTVEGKSAADMTVSYSITGEGLYWGKDETHHFFEAYPSKNVTEIKDGVLTATLPSSQTLRKQDDGTYADMEAALMAGTTSIDKSAINSGSTINLPFKPIFTAVDITISAADNQDFVIHSITVANVEDEENPAPLAGKFYYNYATETISEVSDADKLYNVQAEFPRGIILSKTSTEATATEEAKVTVFLRGDFNKPVKIVLNATSINTSTEQETHGFFKKQGTAAQALTAKARNHINAGKLPTAQLQPMTGEWWVSHMPERTYVSQMSLPGAYDAANFIDHETGDDRAQTTRWTNSDNEFYEQMSAYLNAGNRVFDFKPTYKDGEWINERIMNAGYRQRTIDFKKMVQATDDWLKTHTTEFIIFVMSDYDWENESSGYRANLSTMLKNVIPATRRLDTFKSDITVSEARGKILVINASPCASPIGISVDGWELNHVVKQSGLSVSDGRSEYNERVGKFYTMGDGNIWVHDYNNSYTKTILGFVSNNYDYDNKISLMKQSIDKAAGDTDPKNWYYTCATFRRNSITFDLTYGDSSGKLRPEIVNKVKGLTGTGSGSPYRKSGIVMQAYSAGEGNSNANSFENVIWANNYKGTGAPLAPKKE